MARRRNHPDQLELFPEEPAPPRQSPLAPPRPPRGGEPVDVATVDHALEASIARLVPQKDVEVCYTRNETVILSLSPRRDGRSVLRAHECFRNAPPDVADAAIRLYLKRSRKNDRRHDTHVVTCWHHDAAAVPPSLTRDALHPGVHHDLRAVLEGVNRQWFESALDLDITFGRRPARRTMGRHERRTPRSAVIVNPLLDHPWVTRWYLDYLVFHECLHEVHPARPVRGRMMLHPPEFREHEKTHPDFARVRDYEQWLTGSAYPELRRAAEETISKRSVRESTT